MTHRRYQRAAMSPAGMSLPQYTSWQAPGLCSSQGSVANSRDSGSMVPRWPASLRSSATMLHHKVGDPARFGLWQSVTLLLCPFSRCCP